MKKNTSEKKSAEMQRNNASELQKLNRKDMLKLLLSQQERIESLEKELGEAKKELSDRRIKISQSGSIAEASLKLNRIFEDAQKAVDQYIFNIRTASTEHIDE